MAQPSKEITLIGNQHQTIVSHNCKSSFPLIVRHFENCKVFLQEKPALVYDDNSNAWSDDLNSGVF